MATRLRNTSNFSEMMRNCAPELQAIILFTYREITGHALTRYATHLIRKSVKETTETLRHPRHQIPKNTVHRNRGAIE